jgi:dual specificity protein phosphatase-like protein
MPEERRKPIATLVLPKVWIGDAVAASNATFFRNHDVRAVLNCTPTVPNFFCQESAIEYMRIPVHDTLARRDIKQLYDFFPVICEFIHKITVLQKETMLVNCRLAKQRSAASVAAYLIKYHRLTPHEAMTYLLQRKPDVFCGGRSVNFAAALNRWYHKVKGDSPEVEHARSAPERPPPPKDACIERR